MEEKFPIEYISFDIQHDEQLKRIIIKNIKPNDKSLMIKYYFDTSHEYDDEYYKMQYPFLLLHECLYRIYINDTSQNYKIIVISLRNHLINYINLEKSKFKIINYKKLFDDIILDPMSRTEHVIPDIRVFLARMYVYMYHDLCDVYISTHMKKFMGMMEEEISRRYRIPIYDSLVDNLDTKLSALPFNKRQKIVYNILGVSNKYINFTNLIEFLRKVVVNAYLIKHGSALNTNVDSYSEKIQSMIYDTIADLITRKPISIPVDKSLVPLMKDSVDNIIDLDDYYKIADDIIKNYPNAELWVTPEFVNNVYKSTSIDYHQPDDISIDDLVANSKPNLINLINENCIHDLSCYHTLFYENQQDKFKYVKNQYLASSVQNILQAGFLERKKCILDGDYYDCLLNPNISDEYLIYQYTNMIDRILYSSISSYFNPLYGNSNIMPKTINQFAGWLHNKIAEDVHKYIMILSDNDIKRPFIDIILTGEYRGKIIIHYNEEQKRAMAAIRKDLLMEESDTAEGLSTDIIEDPSLSFSDA